MTHRRSLPLLVLGLALALSSRPAFGFGKNKIVYQHFDWQVYHSIHFEIFYYSEEEEFLDQMISFAESAYDKVSKQLDYQPVKQDVKSEKIPLIYYKTHGEFEQTNISLEQVPEAVGAFAEPFQNRIVLPIDQPPDRVYKVLTHELTHIFEFSMLYGDSLKRVLRSSPPLWIMEGLASYIGEDEDNIDRMVIRDAVVNNILPPIAELNELSFLTYRYGHAVFDFINQSYGPSGIRNFLWEYRKVLLTNNVNHSIKEAFGIDSQEFDRRFNKYLRQKYFPVLMEKNEPADYGTEIGLKKPEQFTFSPTLSPSGELVAALATPRDELDVVILSAKDGKLVRNLTGGFTNKYEHVVAEAFSGQRDLSWSPEGDRVAFFVRRENRRDLLIYDAIRGKKLKTIEMDVDIPASPAFSPDGESILFSGNRAGIFDIFRLDLKTKTITDLTDDNYYDTNPTWSPDGKLVLYDRRIGGYAKVFLLDASDPERKTQLTFGPSSDLMPIFGRDGKTVFFVSDRGPLGIFKLWSLDTSTGELKRWTDLVGGAFAPVQLAGEENQALVAYSGFFRGTFRLYKMDLKKPVETISGEQTPETVDIAPFKPPLSLSADAAEKGRYKLRWNVDAPNINVGVADDGTIFSNSDIVFTDLLGDYRIRLTAASIASFSNIDILFLNLKNRFQWGARVIDVRDYFVAGTETSGARIRRFSRLTGADGAWQYPLNRYYRIEGDIGYFQRRLDIPFFDPSGIVRFDRLKDDFITTRVGLSGDTVRFKEFGPYHGKRFDLDVSRGEQVSGNTGSFTDYDLDFRAYGRLTRRSLLALRLASVISTGPGRTILPLGGFNQLRGYEFRTFVGNRIAFGNLEFRYPLIDELRFPFGSFREIRGTIFVDAGAAWFENGLWFDPQLGTFRSELKFDPVTGQVTSVKFVKFSAFDSENHRLQDLRASWGLGLHFLLGGLEWHWDFAHRFPFTEFRPVIDLVNGTETLKKVEARDGKPRTTFWIGFSF